MYLMKIEEILTISLAIKEKDFPPRTTTGLLLCMCQMIRERGSWTSVVAARTPTVRPLSSMYVVLEADNNLTF